MTPWQRYRADLAREGFHADNHQLQTVQFLQGLHDALQRPTRRAGLWDRLRGRRSADIQGAYLWGGSGRGKTYLMDCFYECLSFADKRRVHFHRFMLEVHRALDRLPRTPDPLEIVAAELARRYRVLCLDEFHVNDVADAMLLAGLLDGMYRRGLVLVATSNTAPEDLYREGLQRERFLPAIDLLKRATRIIGLDGGRDYRLEHLASGGTYRVAEAPESDQWLASRLRDLAPTRSPEPATLEIAGRELQVRTLADDLVWVHFSQLCQSPRSTGDYLELAREFHTLLLQDIPQLGDEQDEAVRRFIHLVDALYDHRVKLIATAACPPAQLYTGARLKEAFRRTVSRLTEMSAEGYLACPHRAD